jgi:hypothetical protein
MKLHRLPILSAGLTLSQSSLAFLSLLSLPAFSQAVVAAAPPSQLSSAPKPAQAAISANYGKLPLSFEANQGQSDPQVKFLARGQGYSLFLTDSAAVLTLTKGTPANAKANPALATGKKSKSEAPAAITDVVRMELSGANPGPHVFGADQLEGKANYFIGNDPSKWRSNVPTYAQVKYTGVYSGVDLLYYGNQRQLEYDFVVAPGADPKPVRLHFAGASKLKLNPNGDLIILAKDGEIAFHKPVIYQIQDGRREPIQGSFALLAGNSIGFHLGAYDHDRELVIDPILAYSTYLGGTSQDYALGIAVDGAGDAYVAGVTNSTNFPVTAGAFQSVNHGRKAGSTNAFVSKLNPAGSALIYSTYLGGSATDSATGIQVDQVGNAYVTGAAGSTDFPVTSGAFQTTSTASPSSPTAFVTKLNSTGSAIVYSTFLGELSAQGSGAIAIDAEGHAFVTGTTQDQTFPVTSGAFQTTDPGPTVSGFVTEFNATGSGLIYSTYFGGSSPPGDGVLPSGIAVDSSGNAYLVGFTSSPGFPTTPGAFQQTAPNSEGTGFVAKLNATGSALVYSTFLGGNFYDGANQVVVDTSGNAYVTGVTQSSNFPVTSGAFQTTNEEAGNYWAAFVTKLNSAGSGLVYSTYLGSTTGSNYTNGLAIDSSGNAYVVGSTTSTDLPTTPDAYQLENASTIGAANAFLTEFNPTGSGLIYSTYLGGAISDFATSVALDSLRNVYLTGSAQSKNLPVTDGAFQPTLDGSESAFITKFDLNATGPHITQTIDFPTIAPQTALTPIDHLYAAASSGLHMTFTSKTPDVCTISGIKATLLTSGYCDIIATQAGNGEYFAVITGQTFLVHHRSQVITFDAIAAQPAGTTLPLTATTDSDLPITYNSTTPTVCTVSGSIASLLATGTCSIQASQAGNATWFPSGPKTASFTVE